MSPFHTTATRRLPSALTATDLHSWPLEDFPVVLSAHDEPPFVDTQMSWLRLSIAARRLPPALDATDHQLRLPVE